MKQVIQSYRTGKLELVDVPVPSPRPQCLIVRNVCSVVSVGTERYMLDLAKKSLLGKAMARPDLVRQVISKARSEGVGEAWRQSMGRLDDPVPLGYSSAGVVVDVGAGVDEFAVGDRVACSGSGFASHAEFVCIPRNMAAKVPEGVSLEDSAFVTLGSIALHSVRMAEPAVGERIVVIGLGLLGLIAIPMLKAAGCRVLGADVSRDKVAMARDFGADEGLLLAGSDTVSVARSFTGGMGADAVLIFAATPSNDPIEMAAQVCREKGRIVVPGYVGLEIPRKPFFEKELSFMVSRAWGPGLFDERYEKRGYDYPPSYVRWTAQRNMAQFLEMVGDGTLRVSSLVTHRFGIEKAVDAYEMILGGKERFIGVLLNYPERPDTSPTVQLPTRDAAPGHEGSVGAPSAVSNVRLGFIGAGLFAKGTLLPALKGLPGCRLRGLATASGVSGQHVGKGHGFEYCTTEPSELIRDPEIDLVVILTRHGSHARFTIDALRAGKRVFVEKPLAVDEDQLIDVIEADREFPGRVMVGFNRRFAPTTQRAIDLLSGVPGPLVINIRVNAGYAPRDSWVHDPVEGGGRIVGEVCHFVDLAQALTRSLPRTVHAVSVLGGSADVVDQDNVALTIRMSEGSLVNIVYAAGGDKTFSRERVEVIGGGAVCVIENFKRMTWTAGGRRLRLGHSWSSVDRGYRNEMKQLVGCVRSGKAMPVRFEEYVATTRATFAALLSLREGRTVDLPQGGFPGSDAPAS